MKKSLAFHDAPCVVDVTAPMPSLALQPVAAADAVNDDEWARVPRMLRGAAARTAGALRSLRALGPYVAIEVLLPGGSVVALALWTYRRWRASRHPNHATTAAVIPAERRAPLRCLASCGSK